MHEYPPLPSNDLKSGGIFQNLYSDAHETSLPQEIGTADFDTLAQQLYGIQGEEDANQKHQFFLRFPKIHEFPMKLL